MADVSDDAQQTPKATDPNPAVPTPHMFARPMAPATEPEITELDATEPEVPVDEASSRFASTGDPRVDRALAQLPDPDEHRRESEDPASHSDRFVGGDHAADDHGADNDSATGIDLPDPGLLDAHLGEVTSVHRQLQQRLSDLSG